MRFLFFFTKTLIRLLYFLVVWVIFSMLLPGSVAAVNNQRNDGCFPCSFTHASFTLINKHNMALITEPLDLGDVFDKTVKLIGKTAGRTATVAAIILLPLTIVMSFIFSSIMQDYSAMILTSIEASEAGRTLSESDARSVGMSFLKILPLAFGVGALFMIAMVAAESAIIRINCNQVDGREITWREALNNAFSGTMWRLIGQRILFVIALGGMYFMAIMPVVVSPSILILTLPALIVAGAWLWTRWFFAPQVIVNEESGVFNSFSRSADLVQGQFWRVLGIGLLLVVISSIAISIISTPIQLVAMSGFWSGYIDMITHAGDETNPTEQLRSMATMLSGIGLGYGIAIGVQAILMLMVQPSYQVVMYYDACARHGELVENDNEEDDFLLS